MKVRRVIEYEGPKTVLEEHLARCVPALYRPGGLDIDEVELVELDETTGLPVHNLKGKFEAERAIRLDLRGYGDPNRAA